MSKETENKGALRLPAEIETLNVKNKKEENLVGMAVIAEGCVEISYGQAGKTTILPHE